MVLTARERVRPFQVKVTGVIPVEVAVFSSRMTTSTLAPAVTVNDLFMLADVKGLLVMPTGVSCNAIAARPEAANHTMARPERTIVKKYFRAQFVVVLGK